MLRILVLITIMNMNLEATEWFTSIYDYDRWQNLQRMIGMVIPVRMDVSLEKLFYVNGIESQELHW